MQEELAELFRSEPLSDSDYFHAQYLINHAEILADGMRYCAASAIFSGSGTELSSGKKGWDFLRKYHGAVCGGTTANVLLSGKSTSAGIHPSAIAAWAEAFAAQADISENPWAMNELIRITYNALMDCFCHSERDGCFQHVNSLKGACGHNSFDPEEGPYRHMEILARLARAAGCVWKHAVTSGQDDIRINYLLPGRYMIHAGDQNAIIQADKDAAHIRCREDFEATIALFYAETETADILLQSGDHMRQIPCSEETNQRYIRIHRKWKNLDTLICSQKDRIIVQDTYHQGISLFVRNQLMVLNPQDSEYRFAVCGQPEINNNQVFIPVKKIARWAAPEGIPADIPILPTGDGEKMKAPLVPYSYVKSRISVFPREKNYVG